MKAVIIGLALAFSSASFAADISIAEATSDIDQTYNKLDIKEIISKTDLSGLCGVRQAELVYLDHQNQQHTYKYLANDECRLEQL
ncbi:DUF2790 domain-containing protein [Pseudomonas sp. NPDC088444]|uniref:DUF2790 domain-containing protein n=1 Tax=Pseudomonas sp. NPDC088444 TaxID=3364456 RepID=UPI00384EBAD7